MRNRPAVNHFEAAEDKYMAKRLRIEASRLWQACTQPRHWHWSEFGGNGVSLRFDSIASLAEYLGTLPGQETNRIVCLIDPDGDVQEGNLKWSTKTEHVYRR